MTAKTDQIDMFQATSAGQGALAIGDGILSALGEKMLAVGLGGRAFVVTDRRVAAAYGEQPAPGQEPDGRLSPCPVDAHRRGAARRAAAAPVPEWLGGGDQDGGDLRRGAVRGARVHATAGDAARATARRDRAVRALET